MPTLATRKRALPAAPPAENNDEKQLSAKQARALAALQIKMTPVVKTPAPHAQDDTREPKPPPPSRRASLDAAAPAAASLQLLTAAAAAECRDDTAMESGEEARDRGAAATMVTLLPLEALEQPVTLGCGHSFELLALQAVASRSRKPSPAAWQAALCPACGEPLPSRLVVNADVQQLVAKLRELQRRARSNTRKPSPTAFAPPAPRRSQSASASTSAAASAASTAAAAAAAAVAMALEEEDAEQAVLSGGGGGRGGGGRGRGGRGSRGVGGGRAGGRGEGGPSAPRHARAGEERDRPKFEVSCLMGRDSDEVRAVLATRHAALHAAVLGRTSLLTHDLPRSCTKRVMRQDSADVRTVSSDAVALMECATELFNPPPFTRHPPRSTLHAPRFTLHASPFTLHASPFTLSLSLSLTPTPTPTPNQVRHRALRRPCHRGGVADRDAAGQAAHARTKRPLRRGRMQLDL